MSNPESANVDAAQRPSAGFIPSAQPRLSAGSLLLVILAFILVFGGFYLMSIAFTFHDHGFWIFAGGLAADVIGFWLAFGIIPSRER